MNDQNDLSTLQLAFRDALTAMDRPLCVQLALDALESGQADLVTLYEQVLAPALNGMTGQDQDRQLQVWREHIRSSIIRSIVECCYPRVLKMLLDRGIRSDKGKVVIVSPAEEYHELGARMGADFFALAGYRAVFVGANTPKKDMLAGIEHEQPDYVVINVVNYYNAFKVKPIVEEIRQAAPGVRILGGGYAFRHDRQLAEKLGLTGVIDSMDDILALEVGQP